MWRITADPLTRVKMAACVLKWTMGINADAKVDIKESIAKKRNTALQTPAKTVESAPFSKKDICAHVNLATEEKYAKFRICVCPIHVCMMEHVLEWITTHLNVFAWGTGKENVAMKKTCVFPTRARTKVTVNLLDSLSNATAQWATKEHTAKLRILVALIHVTMMAGVSAMARLTLNVVVLEDTSDSSAKEQTRVIPIPAHMEEHVSEQRTASLVTAPLGGWVNCVRKSIRAYQTPVRMKELVMDSAMATTNVLVPRLLLAHSVQFQIPAYQAHAYTMELV